MKKISILFLCTCCLFSTLFLPAQATTQSCTTETEFSPYAVVTTINEDGTTQEEVVQLVVENIPIEEIEVFCAPETSTNAKVTTLDFDFAGLEANARKRDSVNHYSPDGIETLYISSCMWSPRSNTVYLGLYNITTGTAYTYPKTGGDLDNVSISFIVPVGTYNVYAKNASSPTLTIGALFYSLS